MKKLILISLLMLMTVISFAEDRDIGAETGPFMYFTNHEAGSARRTPLDLPPTEVVATVNNLVVNLTWQEPEVEVLPAYKVWRLHPGEEQNESVWTLLTPNVIYSPVFTDTNWYQLPNLQYIWAVKAIYFNGVQSVPAFSNMIYVPVQMGVIEGWVSSHIGGAVSGATITCEGFSTTTNGVGHYSLNVNSGQHTVTVTHPSYETTYMNNVIVVTGQTTMLSIYMNPVYVTTIYEGFETYDDFAVSFPPWTLVDQDYGETVSPDGVTYPNANAPQAFMIFNPSATVPPLTDITPHSGNKMAACFAGTMPPNSDYLITPLIFNPLELRFFARSYSEATGLARFKVGVSTYGTIPQSFVWFGSEYIYAPETWTQYYFNLSEYYGQYVYLAIKCASNEALALFIDDLIVEYNGAVDDPAAPDASICLKGNYPNPFKSETTISYSLKESGPVSLEIFNVRGQKVRSYVQEIEAKGDHTVLWDGCDERGQALSGGIYLYRLTAGNDSVSKKMVRLF